MTVFHAAAVREGRWWVIEVPDVGTTQGRTTREADEMARDLIATMLEVDPATVEVRIDYQLPAELDGEVTAAREATQKAARAQEQAAKQTRTAVARIRHAGIAGADVARILGISPQRVSQLIKGSPDDVTRRAG